MVVQRSSTTSRAEGDTLHEINAVRGKNFTKKTRRCIYARIVRTRYAVVVVVVVQTLKTGDQRCARVAIRGPAVAAGRRTRSRLAAPPSRVPNVPIGFRHSSRRRRDFHTTQRDFSPGPFRGPRLRRAPLPQPPLETHAGNSTSCCHGMPLVGRTEIA